MLRKILNILGMLLLFAFIVGTLAFTSLESRNIACRDIKVRFYKNDPIHVSENDILKRVKAADNQIGRKNLEQINTGKIEAELEKIPAVEKAEVYKVIARDSASVYKGVLVVKVKHRKPFVRIMAGQHDYFLDREGNKIPASAGYTAKVPVVTGSVTEELAVSEILPFIEYIEDNEFWKSQIKQIHVENDGDVLLVPLVGGHVIELGSFSDFEKKLRKMEAFYEQVLDNNNWDKYKTISLKYNNQVVAKRN